MEKYCSHVAKIMRFGTSHKGGFLAHLTHLLWMPLRNNKVNYLTSILIKINIMKIVAYKVPYN